MTTYLLDTNHASRLLRGDLNIVRRLQNLTDAHMATSVIVRGELVYMAQKSEQQVINLRNVEALLARLDIYPIDADTADWYGTLKAALINHFGPKERSRRRRATIESIGVTENDLWIAAAAKRHGAIIVSADRDFVRIGDVTTLVIETWWMPQPVSPAPAPEPDPPDSAAQEPNQENDEQ